MRVLSLCQQPHCETHIKVDLLPSKPPPQNTQNVCLGPHRDKHEAGNLEDNFARLKNAEPECDMLLKPRP